MSAAEHVGLPVLAWRASAARALQAICDGRLDEADSVVERMLALGLESGQPDAFTWYGALLATVRMQQGRSDDQIALMEAVIGAPAAEPAVRRIAGIGLLIGRVQGADHDAVRAELDAAVDRDFDAPRDAYWLLYLCAHAYAAARLSDARSASTLLELLRPHRRMIECSGGTIGFSISTLLGALSAVLGHSDEADEYFAESTEIVQRLHAPYHLAFAQMEWARALLQRQPADVDRASALLRDARASAREHGFGEIEREAVALDG